MIDIETRHELLRELKSLHFWLSDHDYIGVKIATGRATIEDYAEEISLMSQYASRVSEIEDILKNNLPPKNDDNGTSWEQEQF